MFGKDSQLPDRAKAIRFEQTVLPHLGSAYNLARWLIRNDHDAEDVVQEAYLRALRFFDGYHGGDSRSWLLTIVRNTCYSWMQRNHLQEQTVLFDEEIHSDPAGAPEGELQLLQQADIELLRQSLEELPDEFREVIVLRELEGLSYREIAEVSNIPLGTVMSRLARARKHLHQCLTRKAGREVRHGV